MRLADDSEVPSSNTAISCARTQKSWQWRWIGWKSLAGSVKLGRRILFKDFRFATLSKRHFQVLRVLDFLALN